MVWDIAKVMTGCGGWGEGWWKACFFTVGTVCVDIKDLLRIRVINENVRVLQLGG